MFYAQSTAKGHTISAKQKLFPPQVKVPIHYLINTHSTLDDWRTM